MQHFTDGLLYQIGTSYTNDNDVRINSRARTGTFDGQTLDNKSFLALRLEADNVSANAYVRWTDDDYSSYTKFRKIALSNNRKELRNLTRSRKRAFEVMHADDSVFVARALEPAALHKQVNQAGDVHVISGEDPQLQRVGVVLEHAVVVGEVPEADEK